MRLALFLTAAFLPVAALAQSPLSAPQPTAIVNALPAPVDQPFPGTMVLNVDATDTARGIFRVTQQIPVPQAGRFTLLYPEWLPGKHGPRGALAELAGLKFTAGGQTLNWVRDPVDVYAFHVDVPAGVSAIDASFEFLSPTRSSEGRIVVTPTMMNLQWEQVSLYPAGYFTRQIPVQLNLTLPQGWTGVAAIDGLTANGNRYSYAPTSYEMLIDSPMFAGANYRKWSLGSNVTLNVVADEARFLEAKPEQIAAHKALVDEALILFGGPRFDRYEFLLALTGELGGIGLEHHRSSENSQDTEYFLKWDDKAYARGLLPHELTHSWNGKYRRPADMWTPDYNMPMRDNLLWVYEGQTSYWDIVLGARSGLQSADMLIGEWARSAGLYSEQPGRDWRSVEDTTHDPIFAARKPKPFSSQSRVEDYYNESSLIWMEADAIIREKSGGKRSLDDFAARFFGGRDGDYGQKTYTFDDIVADLNAVQAHDWNAFLTARFRNPAQPAPLAGLEKMGLRLVWKEEPNVYDKQRIGEGKIADFTHSLGVVTDKDNVVVSVLWNSPAFRAGITNGTKLLSVGGMGYSKDRMNMAITAAKAGTPIALITEKGGRYRDVSIDYRGGLRYPHLERIKPGKAMIDQLLAPRRQSR